MTSRTRIVGTSPEERYPRASNLDQRLVDLCPLARIIHRNNNNLGRGKATISITPDLFFPPMETRVESFAPRNVTAANYLDRSRLGQRPNAWDQGGSSFPRLFQAVSRERERERWFQVSELQFATDGLKTVLLDESRIWRVCFYS